MFFIRISSQIFLTIGIKAKVIYITIFFVICCYAEYEFSVKHTCVT